LLFEPLGGLVNLASRTVAVATTASDPVFAATGVALVVHTTERASAATGDQRDHPLDMDCLKNLLAISNCEHLKIPGISRQKSAISKTKRQGRLSIVVSSG
jgi:hypothetical protein